MAIEISPHFYFNGNKNNLTIYTNLLEPVSEK